MSSCSTIERGKDIAEFLWTKFTIQPETEEEIFAVEKDACRGKITYKEAVEIFKDAKVMVLGKNAVERRVEDMVTVYKNELEDASNLLGPITHGRNCVPDDPGQIASNAFDLSAILRTIRVRTPEEASKMYSTEEIKGKFDRAIQYAISRVQQ